LINDLLPYEFARATSYSALFYLELWKCHFDDRNPRSGTKEIRVDNHVAHLISLDLFADPSAAEHDAVSEAFYWMPVKQAWNLTRWLMDDKAGPERHEKYTWLRKRANPDGEEE
jgi:hypothetical protein